MRDTTHQVSAWIQFHHDDFDMLERAGESSNYTEGYAFLEQRMLPQT